MYGYAFAMDLIDVAIPQTEKWWDFFYMGTQYYDPITNKARQVNPSLSRH